MGTVVLVIDMQQDFFEHARLALLRPDLIVNINQLVATARDVGLSIIWVKQEFTPDLSDASLEVKTSRIRVTIAGTPGASLLPDLDVRQSDVILVKKRYSAFFGTDLDQILASDGCSQLVIAGINTHACVRATVVDAYQRDIDVVLARDCIASHDEEHDRITWRYMDGKLGRGFYQGALLDELRSYKRA